MRFERFDRQARRRARRAYATHFHVAATPRRRRPRRGAGTDGLPGGPIPLLALAAFAIFYALLGWWEAEAPRETAGLTGERYGLCHSGGGYSCVVDGDTFRHRGERIRILDIDTPETHPPRCAREARLGAAATDRLHELLNAGPVAIEREGEDRYGRTLARVERDGESLGAVLVAEGLARPYGNGRRPWC